MLNALEKNDEKKKHESFVVDNDKKAVWCLRKIKHLKEKQQKKRELAETEIEIINEEIAEVKDWLKKENDKLQNSIEFMETLLYSYAQKLREDDPELKTHKLPFGELQFRSRRPKWKYDEQKILDFVSSNYEELVKTKESVDKRKLKKIAEIAGDKAVIKDTGEVIAGIEIIKRGEEFKVKTD